MEDICKKINETHLIELLQLKNNKAEIENKISDLEEESIEYIMIDSHKYLISDIKNKYTQIRQNLQKEMTLIDLINIKLIYPN